MVESAMLDPQFEDPALEHLAAGLRALARRTALPFGLAYPDGTTTYWTGRGFESAHGGTSGQLRLAVSHFRVGESSFLLSPDNRQASARGAGIAKALTDHVHCCSNKILLDGRDVSNIFNEPNFGSSSLRHPLYFLRTEPESDTPSLRLRAQFLPPDTGISIPLIKNTTGKVVECIREAYQPCLAAALITAFLQKTGSGEHVSFQPLPRTSQLVWVTDGVEVAREELDLPKCATAMLVYCSAEGLPTDLSGLIPRDTDLKKQRFEQVMLSIRQCLASTPTAAQVSPFVGGSIGFVIVGGLIALLNPAVGITAVIGGGFSYMTERAKSNNLAAVFGDHLAKLRKSLKSKWKPQNPSNP